MTIRLLFDRPIFCLTLLIIYLSLLTLSGCQFTSIQPAPQGSSVPMDKKYPAAVLVGVEANLKRGTVKNSSSPLPAEAPFYFSVRSFGGFGVKELTAELYKLEPEISELKENPLVFSTRLPVSPGKTNVLGSISPLPPGEYHLVIYRLEEDIAARQFQVEKGED